MSAIHLQSLVPGSGVYDMSRNSAGTGSLPTLIDGNDAITRISSAGAQDGTLHVQTVVPGVRPVESSATPQRIVVNRGKAGRN